MRYRFYPPHLKMAFLPYIPVAAAQIASALGGIDTFEQTNPLTRPGSGDEGPTHLGNRLAPQPRPDYSKNFEGDVSVDVPIVPEMGQTDPEYSNGTPINYLDMGQNSHEYQGGHPAEASSFQRSPQPPLRGDSFEPTITVEHTPLDVLTPLTIANQALAEDVVSYAFDNKADQQFLDFVESYIPWFEDIKEMHKRNFPNSQVPNTIQRALIQAIRMPVAAGLKIYQAYLRRSLRYLQGEGTTSSVPFKNFNHNARQKSLEKSRAKDREKDRKENPQTRSFYAPKYARKKKGRRKKKRNRHERRV